MIVVFPLIKRSERCAQNLRKRTDHVDHRHLLELPSPRLASPQPQAVLMKLGDQVETLDGKWSGTVVAIFTATGGERRIVVNVDGALRIYAADELRVTSSSDT